MKLVNIFLPFHASEKTTYDRTITDNIVFTSSFSEIVSNNNAYTVTLTDTIVFSSNFNIVSTSSFTDHITFSDSFINYNYSNGGYDFTLSDVITFSDSAHDTIYKGTISNNILFVDHFYHFVYYDGGYDFPLEDTIDFVEHYKLIYIINDIIPFKSDFSNYTIYTLKDKIFFDQDFIPNVPDINTFSDILFFDDTFIISGDFTQTLSDNLQFIDDWIAFIYPNSKFLYLQSPNGSVTLESPLFNDLESNINNLLISRGVGGARYSYVKNSNRKHLKYEFNIRCRLIDDFLTFIEASILDSITLINWKQEVWTVKIVNEPVIKAISSDVYSVVLEFEGYKNGGTYLCQE